MVPKTFGDSQVRMQLPASAPAGLSDRIASARQVKDPTARSAALAEVMGELDSLKSSKALSEAQRRRANGLYSRLQVEKNAAEKVDKEAKEAAESQIKTLKQRQEGTANAELFRGWMKFKQGMMFPGGVPRELAIQTVLAEDAIAKGEDPDKWYRRIDQMNEAMQPAPSAEQQINKAQHEGTLRGVTNVAAKEYEAAQGYGPSEPRTPQERVALEGQMEAERVKQGVKPSPAMEEARKEWESVEPFAMSAEGWVAKDLKALGPRRLALAIVGGGNPESARALGSLLFPKPTETERRTTKPESAADEKKKRETMVAEMMSALPQELRNRENYLLIKTAAGLDGSE